MCDMLRLQVGWCSGHIATRVICGVRRMWVTLFAMIGAIFGPVCVGIARDVLHGSGWGWVIALYCGLLIGTVAGILLGIWKQLSDKENGNMTSRRRVLLACVNLALL